MGSKSKRDYLKAIRERYRKASREEKSVILNEFCQVCGYNRKYAIRRLNRRSKPAKRRPGPKPIYGADVIVHLKRFWLLSDQMCSKRLVKVIELWLPYYELEYGGLPEHIKKKLLQLSPATIDRLLKPARFKYKTKGKCTTKPGKLLRNVIKIRPDKASIQKPGFIEADSVAHCGNSMEGEFVWSITYTDICSTWTENRAVWGKGATGFVEQTKDAEQNLPFAISAFWSDNGSEFMNYHFLRYFADRKTPINFYRSRPYKKNDNAHVEQKNWTHVRQLLGYDRFDKAELVPLINDLYKVWSLFQNHFCPTRKLKEKLKINSKYVKTYDKPDTPYQRLLDSPHLTGQAKERLCSIHSALNPFSLKKDIEKKLKKIFNRSRLP
ncbi:MAG: integrase [Nitrospinota bacterium]